jgi:hypothetical protein
MVNREERLCLLQIGVFIRVEETPVYHHSQPSVLKAEALAHCLIVGIEFVFERHISEKLEFSR